MKAHKGKSDQDGTHGEAYADAAVHDAYAGGNSPTAHEAEERKHGGRTKRKHGGKAKKMEMKVHGEMHKMHAGRKPRKSGGRATSDMNPFTSARKGTAPTGHNVEMEYE